MSSIWKFEIFVSFECLVTDSVSREGNAIGQVGLTVSLFCFPSILIFDLYFFFSAPCRLAEYCGALCLETFLSVC